jgi:hypothetical protein
MYEPSTAFRHLDSNLRTIRAENERFISRIEAKLDSVCAELRAIRCEIKTERSDADLDRWFWILMLTSVVLNLTLRAMLNS